MLFYKVAVFPQDFIVSFYDDEKKKRYTVVNDYNKIREFYHLHKDEIWTGYNSRLNEQYLIKGILAGKNPYLIYKYIASGKQGFTYHSSLNNYPIINYDVMQGIDKSLDMVKAFNGNDVTTKIVTDTKLTDEELQIAKAQCIKDVHYISNVFHYQIDQYNAMKTLVEQFNLPLGDIGKTEANITAKILGCEKQARNDENKFIIENYIHLSKYPKVLEFYQKLQNTNILLMYKQKLECVVANVKHKFGWGGIHGAKEKYKFTIKKGRKCWHIDVTSYYPSYLIAHNKITRTAKYPEKYVWSYEHQIELKKQGKKKERLPFKKMLNALSGAMKDKHNAAYDPCMNNTMVVNCQLSTLMLIEMLEDIDGFSLTQSNTDGLIIEIPDTKEAEQLMYDICHKWEDICSTDKASIKLEFDEIEWLYQKDVNNYIYKFVGSDKIERKGAYLKELSNVDYNTPILNEALVKYFINHISIEDTINNCNNLVKFQIIREVSEKFDGFMFNQTKLKEKCIRIFASNNADDGIVYKYTNDNSTVKVEGTPMHCFIDSGEINNKDIPQCLDKQWYIDEAKKRLRSFGEECA